MPRRFDPRWLVGKTIEHVDMRPFPRGKGYPVTPATNPVIYFTDGSKITFTGQETEAEPGVRIMYWPAPKRRKA